MSMISMIEIMIMRTNYFYPKESGAIRKKVICC
jgi:hypothetical protein